MENIDWSDCPLIERVPGKMSGEPVIKGTRVLARTIVDNFEGGSSVEEIHENYPHVSSDTIRTLISYHQSHSRQPVR
jgi:uncharacterized protein (DUF433 family)